MNGLTKRVLVVVNWKKRGLLVDTWADSVCIHQLEKDESFFQMKINKKKEKIKKLKTELQAKEQELKSAQQEARMQQEELLKAEAEVEKKHEEVKKLQREREELAQAYNIENLKVSKCIQSTVVTTSRKEMKVTCWVVAIHYPHTHCIFVYRPSCNCSNVHFMGTKTISLTNELVGPTMHIPAVAT